ncbi:hypothetical protein J4423_01640 [Candidatus Pacearchaeota archaeon]|nr:hypothetical protein [Candidatus Pacearchaeota archaeon]
MENVVSNEIKRHPKTSTLTLILLLTLIVAFVGAFKQSNWSSMIIVIITAVLICLPRMISRFCKVEIPGKLGFYAVLFIYATLFLGELKNYYAKFWWWDVLVHTSSGLAFGIVGFLILHVMYSTGKIKTSPKMVAMFAFAFALALGALWEIVEFGIDSAFSTVRMQGGSLSDTMWDLIVDSLGALFSAIMGYLHLKKESGIVVKSMMKEFKKDNPKMFKKNNKK